MLKDVKNNTFTRTGLEYCVLANQIQLSYHKSPMNSGFKGDNNSTVHHCSNTVCVMFANNARECAFHALKIFFSRNKFYLNFLSISLHFFGVLLDAGLSWKNHIYSVCS